MFFDPTIVIVFGTLFLCFVLSLVYAFWYQNFKHKYKHRSRTADDANSVTVSGLNKLIREAVTEATRSLDERMAGVETRVEALPTRGKGEALLNPPERKPSMESPADDREEEFVQARKRVR